MAKLILHGPRRRASERVKHKRESTKTNEPTSPTSSKVNNTGHSSSRRALTQPSARSAKSGTRYTTTRRSKLTMHSPPTPEDTIKVRQKSGPVEISDDSDDESPLSDLERLGESIDQSLTSKATTATGPTPSRPWARSGKAPVREVDEKEGIGDASAIDVDVDENVEEYDFDNESEYVEEDDDGRDTIWHKDSKQPDDAVVTISSDSDDKSDENANFNLERRPWLKFDAATRMNYEHMFCRITEHPMSNDWGITEDYMRERDKEMLMYLEDFTLPDWVIPRQQAQEGYDRLVVRQKLRHMGVYIYNQQNRSEWVSAQGSTTHSKRTHSQMQTNQQMPMRTPHEQAASQFLPQMQPPRPLPSQVLRSQPTSSLNSLHANGTPTLSHGGPSTHSVAPPHSTASPAFLTPNSRAGIKQSNTSSRNKDRNNATPPPDLSVAPPPTPPYETRPRPADRRLIIKRALIKHNDAFPWNRDLDFKKARAQATWDDSIYEQETLADIAATQMRNKEIIAQADKAESDRQRTNRANKKNGIKPQETDKALKRPRGKASQPDISGGDPYQCGSFVFATDQDAKKAKMMEMKSPDEMIEVARLYHMDVEDCAKVRVYWNPAKKGLTQFLEKPQFTVKDIVVTLFQLDKTPVLTLRAAECVIDFCPHLLWRGMLLRIIAEAGYINKRMRDRMCSNGNYLDKATMTKRIGSALGQKQQQSGTRIPKGRVESASNPNKVKGYLKGEDEYYNANIKDNDNYIRWFGKSASYRTPLNLERTGSKDQAAWESSDEVASHSSRDFQSSGIIAESGDEKGDSTNAEATSEKARIIEDEETAPDAVSIQSDTLLDEMDED